MCGFPKNLVYVLVDLVCVLIVALPIMILKFAGQPSQRGFFCDDQTISYPFYESTVPTWMLVIFGGGIPLLCMLVGEAVYIHRTTKTEGEEKKKFPFLPYFIRVYKTVGIFLFGTLSTQCLTDLFKYTIGRLRPNFLSVCAPDYSRFNCTDAMGRYVYVTDYVCTGDPDQIRESRLSFISGHASLSFFFMVYLVLYLQVRITWRQSWLLKPFLQVVAVILAQLTMLSRVNDNKHHWSDVLAGTALGTFVALLVGLSVSDLFPKMRQNPDQSVVPERVTPRPEDEEEGALEVVATGDGENGKRNSQGMTTIM
ncbi:PREDICTED: phospholipid phosphatase 1-like isoform X1 [Branchiostoma belcheri]|uniref:Phospholipid phosphatase 1-like isoform X1 n=1 Tax=Branchiostoma belcheri TaxID=7741 RepID=A0A6P4ZLJ9_BRABE|nr:PREDICTED: phospholipid phosphatase 1-like isoform X1 [Branchiostoma belcheri]